MFTKIRMWQKHHGIELFGIYLLLVCVGLVAISGTIKMTASSQDRDFLNENAIYASEFITSLSGIAGNIEAVYVNPSDTKCAIVLHMAEINRTSTDAADYQLYVKGFNVSRGEYATMTLNNYKGGYYVFGSTGYAMIYLTDAAGFQNQAIEIVVRCNEVFSTVEGNADVAALAEKDASYANNDQFRIIVNPKGSAATEVEFLDDLDVVKLYQNTVLLDSEEEIRATLKTDVKELNQYLAQINAYGNNLRNMGVKVPALPECIAGDEFYNLENEENTLVYKPNYVFANGVDFDWFERSLMDDYRFLPELVGGKSDYQYLNDIAAQHDFYSQEQFNWVMMDGTRIDRNSNSQLQDDVTLQQTIDAYELAITNYIRVKTQYQTIDLMSYLNLEYNMTSTGKTFTSNYGDDTVIVW